MEPSAAALGLPGTPTLADWQPGQCVIITDVEFLLFTQNVWLHSLYIRHHRTTRTDTDVVMRCWSRNCNLWMTDVTIQGDDSEGPAFGGLVVNAGQAYASGAVTSCIRHA